VHEGRRVAEELLSTSSERIATQINPAVDWDQDRLMPVIRVKPIGE